MKTTTSSSRPVSKMYCNVFGHQYEVTKKVTKYVKEYTCKCCKKQLTTDANGRLIELTPTFREINSLLKRIHTSRMFRLSQKTLEAVKVQPKAVKKFKILKPHEVIYKKSKESVSQPVTAPKDKNYQKTGR